MNGFDEQNEFDARLSEALSSPNDAVTGAHGAPPVGTLEAIRERGDRRRRRKIAGVASAAVVTLFVAGAAVVARDDGGSIQTAAVPSTAPTSTTPATTSTSTTVATTTTTTTPTTVVATTVPATIAPSTVPVTAAPTTAPPTTAPPTTAPPTTVAPTTSTTVPVTTPVAPPSVPPASAIPVIVTADPAPVTKFVFDEVQVDVTGSWPEANAPASMLVYDWSKSAHVVLANGRETVRVTSDCVPGASSCSPMPGAWLIDSSLWLAVDDRWNQIIVEVDLRTGTMVERMRVDGWAADFVGTDSGVRFVVSGSEQPTLSVVDYADGQIIPRLAVGGSETDRAVLFLDRANPRVLVLRPGESQFPVLATYEVYDAESLTLERSGSLSVEFSQLDVFEFVGNRVILGDSFIASGALLDLDAGGVTHEFGGPGCLLTDGTAVFETRDPSDGVTAGPLVVVGLDGEARELSVIGTGHNEGSTSCDATEAIIHGGDGSVTLMTADGVTTPAGYEIVDRTILQVGGRAVRY